MLVKGDVCMYVDFFNLDLQHVFAQVLDNL